MLFTRAFACLLLSLTAACGAGGGAQISSATPAADTGDSATRGKAFAQAHCAACHAIDAGISPLAEAPSFAATINSPGLTAETLRPWLRDSHNYPEIMNFAIAPAQIDDLTSYMLTLKQPDYKPPIQ